MTTANNKPADEPDEVNIDDTIGILAINMAAVPAVEIFEALEELFGMTDEPVIDRTRHVTRHADGQ